MTYHIRNIRIKFLIMITASFLLIFSSLQANNNDLIENSSVCLDCHEDMDQSLMLSSHRLLSEGDLSSPVVVGCTSCHDGWQEHIEDPAVENIISGREIGGLEQAQICARCHQEPHQAAMVTDDPHGRNDINCSDCHQVHNNSSLKLVKDDDQKFCQNCHLNVAAQFKSRSSHPLESGNVNCTDCHMPRVAKSAVGQTNILDGDVRSHLFTVNTSADALQFTDDGAFANPYLTLDYMCKECHEDKDQAWMAEHAHDLHATDPSHAINSEGSELQ